MTPEELQNSVIKLRSSIKTFKWILAVSLLLLVFLIVWLTRPSGNSSNAYVKSLQDSMKVHDKMYLARNDSLIGVVSKVNDRLEGMEKELDETDAKLAQVQSKYDKVRNNIAHSSTDDKLRFLSARLPKSDGSGK